MFLDSACSCPCTIYWSQVFSGEWRCSWSSADRRCSNYIWVINNFIAYSGTSYIRDLTVGWRQLDMDLTRKCLIAPSHYMNQCWLLIHEVLWYSYESNVISIAQTTIPYNEFENEMYTPTPPRGQWVNPFLLTQTLHLLLSSMNIRSESKSEHISPNRWHNGIAKYFCHSHWLVSIDDITNNRYYHPCLS